MTTYTLPTINKQTETVILANGEFPSHPIPLSILYNCKYLVCCDGAMNNLSQLNKVPDAIVGDCDSLSADNFEKYKNIVHQVPEQDTNDLTKSVNFCLAQNRSKITILGATGKREDHTIANISLLCEYMKEADVEMITDHGIFVGISSDAVFESHAKQQVSLFSIDKCTVSSHNLVYGIDNYVFTSWWQATLNESKGNEFAIKTDGKMVIYRTF